MSIKPFLFNGFAKQNWPTFFFKAVESFPVVINYKMLKNVALCYNIRYYTCVEINNFHRIYSEIEILALRKLTNLVELDLGNNFISVSLINQIRPLRIKKTYPDPGEESTVRELILKKLSGSDQNLT